MKMRWVLFQYRGLDIVILSKPFRTKKLAEQERLKYPPRIARTIGIGGVPSKSDRAQPPAQPPVEASAEAPAEAPPDAVS